MFFHRKKRNTLLYQASGHSAPVHRKHHTATAFLFSRFFSAWKLGGMIFLVLLVGGVLTYGLFFSTEFQIKTIRVQGASSDDAAALTSATQQLMQQKILRIIPRTSYFLFPQAEVLSSLETQFPRLSSITISRPSPNDIVISVAERNIVGIWCAGNAALANPNGQTTSTQQVLGQTQAVISTQGQCAFFDKDGVIFNQAPDATSGHLLFVVYDARQQALPALGTHVLEAATYAFLQNLRSALTDANHIPVSFTIKNSQEVDANFLDGNHAWDVYFSTGYSAAYQVDVLSRLLSETIGDKNFPYLDYIDVRLENKAFYSLHH